MPPVRMTSACVRQSKRARLSCGSAIAQVSEPNKTRERERVMCRPEKSLCSRVEIEAATATIVC